MYDKSLYKSLYNIMYKSLSQWLQNLKLWQPQTYCKSEKCILRNKFSTNDSILDIVFKIIIKPKQLIESHYFAEQNWEV